MKLNSKDLSSFNRCTIRRNHNEITTKSAKGNAYNKAVLVKSIIKESLINKLSSKEIKEKLIEGFKENANSIWFFGISAHLFGWNDVLFILRLILFWLGLPELVIIDLMSLSSITNIVKNSELHKC